MTAKRVQTEPRKIRADAADRAMKAWQARVMGMDWKAVAQYAGYADAATANRGVKNYFGVLPEIDTAERRELWRARLEYLWRQTATDVKEQRPGAVRSAVAVAARAAALDGLDAPSQLTVGYRPDADEFNATMVELRALVLGEQASEGDIFAIEN